MRRWRRGLAIVFRLLPFVVAFLRDRRRWVVAGRPARRSREHHRRRAERLATTLAKLGPTFIKLAQLFSSRADILPEPYLSAVGKLQDHVPPDRADEIIGVVEAELDEPVGDLFDDFEREPVAAASLGQVHRARSGGREVVVKVLRPEVEELVAVDLEISFRLLFWLNVLFRNHHIRALTNVVREFSVRVQEEMDFRREAENIARFRTHFGSEPGVRVPDVLEEFTRRRVLVMEYCPGRKVDALHAMVEAGSLEVEELMERLTGLYLRMMMVDGFLHADPHPGNILVQDDGTIVLLDWGMVLDVPRWTRKTILEIALAVARDDIGGMINGMYELGMIDPQVSRQEVREAAEEVLAILTRFQTSNRARIQRMVQEILDTFYTWPLLLPQELVYFFRTAALLEGIGFRYDPRFDGLSVVKRVVRSVKPQVMRAAEREPMDVAWDLVGDARDTLKAVRELVRRAEREELRVRMHPRDLQHHERFLSLQARRLLLSVFAVTLALIASITFIAVRNWWILAGGLVGSLFMFVFVFFVPTHLLENPLRHARGIRPRSGGAPADDESPLFHLGELEDE